jgi:AcrR family transcriptional regulator
MPAPINEHRILEATLAVWREEGYRNATTRKVADRAGIGEITLFRRFGDKAALFNAALASEALRFRNDNIYFSGDVQPDLMRIVEAYGELLERNGEIILDFLVNTPRDESLAALAPIPLEAIAAVIGVIMQHQATGKLRLGPPPVLILDLLSPVLMRHMLERVQPALITKLDAGFVVSGFLNGWKG